VLADQQLAARLQEAVEIGDRGAERGNGAEHTYADHGVEEALCFAWRGDCACADQGGHDRGGCGVCGEDGVLVAEGCRVGVAAERFMQRRCGLGAVDVRYVAVGGVEARDEAAGARTHVEDCAEGLGEERWDEGGGAGEGRRWVRDWRDLFPEFAEGFAPEVRGRAARLEEAVEEQGGVSVDGVVKEDAGFDEPEDEGGKVV